MFIALQYSMNLRIAENFRGCKFSRNGSRGPQKKMFAVVIFAFQCHIHHSLCM